MDAQLLIKLEAIRNNYTWDKKEFNLTDFTEERINGEFDIHEGFEDAISDVRESGVETDLPCQDSRHYESESRAFKSVTGQWVGYTYWYGGGKHGNPEEIEWIDDAYLLDVEEKEVTVVKRTFTKK